METRSRGSNATVPNLQDGLFPTRSMLDFAAMASRSTWVKVLAGIKMLYDLVKFGPDHSANYLKYLGNPETYAEACRVSDIFSTSSGEMTVLITDIKECRDRLLSNDSGNDRAQCLCSIFNKIKAGNGGSLPPIDDWQRIYDEMGCGTKD